MCVRAFVCVCVRARMCVCACDSTSGMAVCFRERQRERERFDIIEDVSGSTKLQKTQRQAGKHTDTS